ncbi:MAG: T9SS type A sorting domain-containing protein [Candidatus Electryonea clarkiae]|nr:T9SS type A sorting domain-containing protein [Candidatus Electryonea clarkiae]MDP8287053.1 T9SS type A sorting domain-containing protein [Candidatus Electryonea clarkiae]
MKNAACLIRIAFVSLFIIGIFSVFPANAQVVIDVEDIPIEPGTIQPYYIESDPDGIEVDLGRSGPDRDWDFAEYVYDGVQYDSIMDPDDAPDIDSFPTANRVSRGAGGLGFGDENTFQYEVVADSGWFLIGLGMNVANLDLPIPFPRGVMLMPMPAELGDEWAMGDTTNYYIPFDSLFIDSLRLEFVIGGDGEADAWGTVEYPDGEADALRIHSTLGLVVNAYGIGYLMEQRIEVPLGEMYRMDATQSYTWFSPGTGQLATITAQAGEVEPDFELAASVRVRYVSPELEFSDDEINFGEVSVDDTEIVELFIENHGDGTGRISEVVVDSALAEELILMGDLPVLIDPLAEEGISFLWSPGEEGPMEGEIAVYHNDPVIPNPLIFSVEGFAEASAVENNESNLPTTNFLAQNFPNPFNPSTSIRFGIKEAGRLRLTVYDLAGREVAVLSNGFFRAGIHEVQFDASVFASGIYFYAVDINGYHEIKKMILMK